MFGVGIVSAEKRIHFNKGPNKWHYKMKKNEKNSSQDIALPPHCVPRATVKLNVNFKFFMFSANQRVSQAASVSY